MNYCSFLLVLLLNYNGICRLKFGFISPLVEKYEDGRIIKNIPVTNTREISFANMYV
jgi:hypothetical protein